jgi:type II restriction enzyme
MSRKADLRKQRDGTVINATSKKQETDLVNSLQYVVAALTDEFSVELRHDSSWKLSDVVSGLKVSFPEVDFHYHFETSSMRPDGGILSLVGDDGISRPVLITEVKNQGTNDVRATEGKPKQSKGNAIERLGKNVIGFRAAMMNEGIMPFVCFGYGCDFADDSSIRDRVSTIAMFGPLNQIAVVNQGEAGTFNRGSFFFREEKWSPEEMSQVMLDVARRSIFYYFARYGEDQFKVV